MVAMGPTADTCRFVSVGVGGASKAHPFLFNFGQEVDLAGGIAFAPFLALQYNIDLCQK